MPRHTSRSFPPVLAGLLTGGMLIAFLYVAKPVVIPLALSVLLAFVLAPVVSLIQHRTGLPRLPAVALTTLVTLSLLAAGGYVLGSQVRGLVKDLDDNKDKIRAKLGDLVGQGSGALSELSGLLADKPPPDESPKPGEPDEKVKRPAVQRVTIEKESGAERLIATALPVIEPLATVALVVVLVVFFLVNREDLRNRVIGLLGHGQLTGTTRLLSDAGERVGKYLLSQLLVNLGFGTVFGIGLSLLGVDYGFLWGVLAMALRFIPYVGSWIACAFPLAYSFANSTGWSLTLEVFAFFAVLDLLVGQVLEPIVFGHSTGVSPVALLVAAAFWGWLWGPMGLLLSTPLTVCLVTIGQHVPKLGFLAVLMGDRPGLAPHLAFYQRLLAKDEGEAKDMMQAYTKEHGLADAFDTVLVPALAVAGRDRRRDELSADDEATLLTATEAVREAITAPLPRPEGEPPPPEPTLVAKVFGFPARNTADELALRMLSDLLRPDGYPVEVLPARVLPQAVDARVEADKPAVLVLSVLPPGGMPQAMFQVKRLRQAHPDLPIVVAHLGKVRDFDAMLLKFRRAGASYVVTTLAQAAGQVKTLASAPKPSRTERRQPAGVA